MIWNKVHRISTIIPINEQLRNDSAKCIAKKKGMRLRLGIKKGKCQYSVQLQQIATKLIKSFLQCTIKSNIIEALVILHLFVLSA
jgi:hypothetical protein